MRRIPALVLFVASLAFALRATPAGAQGTGGSMDIDVSIRSAGMGGASNAVLWGGGLDHWGNPAVLGAERGLRWEWGRSELIPEFPGDVIFESHVLKIAGAGHGVVLSGLPAGPGVRLEYRVSGSDTGRSEGFEQVDSWGFGVSLFETVERVVRPNGRVRNPISRYLDVAFGMNFKEIEAFYPYAGRSTTRAKDWGATLRITPVDRETEAGTPIRVDAAVGISVLSANDDAELMVPHITPYLSPVSRHRRSGIAMSFTADPAGGRNDDRQGWTWMEHGFSPLLSFGIAADRSKIGEGAYELLAYTTNGQGVELGLANVLFGRCGRYEDLRRDIDGTTWGWGVQIPFGRVAGIRYDGARIPRSAELTEVVRHGAARVDLLEMHHAMAEKSRATL